MKTVFVNGCFDILHIGHIELLTYAKQQGDKLIVAIDSDRRVTASKGLGRPYNCQLDRQIMLCAIRWVDDVVIFDSDDMLRQLTATYQPDIMIVGSDWKDKTIIGSESAKKLLYFDRIGTYSTTNILNNRK